MDEIEQFVTDNNDAHKEVEEMTKVLDEIEAIMWENAAYDTPDMAKSFYNAGYRNVKDKVVLSKEELIERYRQEHEWASRETAREIKNKFRELLSQYCEKMSRGFAFKILDETFKQLCVEVE